MNVKESQLGMKLGTANNILTRNLMFLLAQKCGMDICHRCGKKIESADDISRDHVVDWLHSDNPVKFFLDAANVAFSHKKCNKKRKKWNATGGIYFCNDAKRRKPWIANISLNDQTKLIGRFETKEEAIRERVAYIKNFLIK